MTKTSYRSWLAPFAVVVLAFVAGCGSSGPQNNGSGGNGTPSVVAQVQKKEISINKDLPGARADATKNRYLIFDGSGSMGDNCDERRKIDGAKWAAEEYLKKVSPSDNVALYVFDSRGARQVVPLGSGNRDQILKEIRRIEADGGTPLAEALRYGADHLKEQYQKQLGYGEYHLVVVTDGQASDIPEAAQGAVELGFSIETIGFCMGEDHELRKYSTMYRRANSAEDLAKGLEQTLAELPSFDENPFKGNQPPGKPKKQ